MSEKSAEITNTIPFSILAKPTGSLCNMDCTYCFYLEKAHLYNKKTIVSEDLLEKYIKDYLTYNLAEEPTMLWQGGEPTLLGLRSFEKIIQWQKKYGNGRKVNNSLQTNGTLIDDNWAKFFHDNNFLIGLSIDGGEKEHNHYRKLKGGQATFDKVMRAVELFKKHEVEFNTLTVLTSQNVKKPAKLYNFLSKEIGSRWLQFIPLTEVAVTRKDRGQGLTFGSPSVDKKEKLLYFCPSTKEYEKFMKKIFDIWYENDIGKVMIRFYEDLFMKVLGYKDNGNCFFSKNCGNNPVLEHNGDMFSCDHYVYPEYKLGNINCDSMLSLVNSQQQKDFLNAKSKSLSKDCLKCNYLQFCYGGCPKHRFEKSSTGEFNQNRMCSAYKGIFRHVLPRLEEIAKRFNHMRGLPF